MNIIIIYFDSDYAPLILGLRPVLALTRVIYCCCLLYAISHYKLRPKGKLRAKHK